MSGKRGMKESGELLSRAHEIAKKYLGKMNIERE